MNAVANGNPAFTLRANQRSPVVGSELTVETVVVANDDFVWVASEYPYRWFWRSTERSNMPIRSRPDVSNTLHGMNWSPRSVNATGADHVAPWSNDWLTITSEFVLAEYGSLGAGSWILSEPRGAGLAIGVRRFAPPGLISYIGLIAPGLHERMAVPQDATPDRWRLSIKTADPSRVSTLLVCRA